MYRKIYRSQIYRCTTPHNGGCARFPLPFENRCKSIVFFNESMQLHYDTLLFSMDCFIWTLPDNIESCKFITISNELLPINLLKTTSHRVIPLLFSMNCFRLTFPDHSKSLESIMVSNESLPMDLPKQQQSIRIHRFFNEWLPVDLPKQHQNIRIRCYFR